MCAATGSSSSWLARATLGDVLGAMSRVAAEAAYQHQRLRSVAELTWSGDAVEGAITHPYCRVALAGDPAQPHSRAAAVCSRCGQQWCEHVGAIALKWLELRDTLRRGGPGTMWRDHALQPFVTPPEGARHQEIDLSHIKYVDELIDALRFQVSLQLRDRCPARLDGDRLEVQVSLPAGAIRLVTIPLSAVPEVLDELRDNPHIETQGELAGLTLSSQRLHPVLRASLTGDHVVVEPGYRLPSGRVLTLEAAQEQLHGRWLRDGDQFFRLVDPPATAIGVFKRGRTELAGEAALSFLVHDHLWLREQRWYEPQGELSTLERLAEPVLDGLDADLDTRGQVVLTPRFRLGGREFTWRELAEVFRRGFGRIGGGVIRAPNTDAFAAAGLKGHRRGFVGDRWGMLRLVAETSAPVRSKRVELNRILAGLGGEFETLPVPPGLRSSLRGYQRDGVAWMWRLRQAGLGALLADEMGLGKTHEAMALLCHVRAQDPGASFLVVCPRGVLDHWQTLLQAFAPELPVAVFHGAQRSLAGVDSGVVLTTYDIALRSVEVLSARTWTIAIFDEAQRIKNPRTKGAHAARTIPADFRLVLTGTPIENHLVELWSVVDLALPGYLGSERGFRTAYHDPHPADLDRLRRRVAPFVLRRIKSQVLADLPPKSEEIMHCRLINGQRELYDRIRQQSLPELAARLADGSAEIPYMHIFALLTRLKQTCDHPALLDPEFGGAAPGKFEVLDEILAEALGSEQRVVVFSQYVEMIALLGRHLTDQGIPHLVLTGKTRGRGDIIRRFNAGDDAPILLASLLASGVGIDLTAASVVVHYDRWWNPAREDQATDRVHRIGQTRGVQVFKLVTRDTIEERIAAIIARKGALAAEVVTPTANVLRRLSREELAELLNVPLPS